MSQANEVHALASNNEGDEAEEDPSNQSMCIVSIDVENIAEAQDIKLALTATACCVDWKQNGPCDAYSNKTDENEDLEKSEEQVAIERIVLEDVVVGQSLQVSDCAEEALGASRCASFPIRLVSLRYPSKSV